MLFENKNIQKEYEKLRDKYVSKYGKGCTEVLINPTYVQADEDTYFFMIDFFFESEYKRGARNISDEILISYVRDLDFIDEDEVSERLYLFSEEQNTKKTVRAVSCNQSNL